MAAYILFESYDNYRLWPLIRALIRHIRELDLLCVVGSKKNSDDLRHLLDVVEATDFAGLNPNWASCGRIEPLSPAR